MVTQTCYKKKSSKLKLYPKKINLIPAIRTDLIWTHKKYLPITKLNIISGPTNFIMIKQYFWPTALKKSRENCNKFWRQKNI